MKLFIAPHILGFAPKRYRIFVSDNMFLNVVLRKFAQILGSTWELIAAVSYVKQKAPLNSDNLNSEIFVRIIRSDDL